MIWKGRTTKRTTSEPIPSVREERSCSDVVRPEGYGTRRGSGCLTPPRHLAVSILPLRGNSRFPDPFHWVRIPSWLNKKPPLIKR